MARLPDLVAASARAARSNDSARHAFVIGPAASAGITPSAASARASAASKSSMFCSVAASSQTARIAALDSIGASRGERDVLICVGPTHPGLAMPIPLSRCTCCTCEYASLRASGGLPFGPAVIYLGYQVKAISRRHPHGHDDERRSPT